MFDIALARHLANLSKIAFDEDELNIMTGQMSDIIGLMDKVCEFDPKEKTDTSAPVLYNDLRKDEAKQSFEPNEIVKNAKIVKDNSFVVPKVV